MEHGARNTAPVQSSVTSMQLDRSAQMCRRINAIYLNMRTCCCFNTPQEQHNVEERNTSESRRPETVHGSFENKETSPPDLHQRLQRERGSHFEVWMANPWCINGFTTCWRKRKGAGRSHCEWPSKNCTASVSAGMNEHPGIEWAWITEKLIIELPTSSFRLFEVDLRICILLSVLHFDFH